MEIRDWDFIYVMGIVTLGYLAYLYLSSSKTLQHWAQQISKIGDRSVSDVLMQRILGVLCMGVLPLMLSAFTLSGGLQSLGLGKGNPGLTLIWTLALSGLIVIVNLFNAQKADNLAMYPQIRAAQWSRSLLFQSAITWILYLLAYEFLFRGVLFFGILEHTGFWGATAINASVYALAHLPKGQKETLGAIPFGILLCWLTFTTGSIWLAVAVHVVLALSNEWFSLHYHPEMQVQMRREE